jgi:predicted methyltransferase
VFSFQIEKLKCEAKVKEEIKELEELLKELMMKS